MFKSKFFTHTAAATAKKLAVLSLLITCMLFAGHVHADLPQEQAVAADTKLLNTVDSLAIIQKSIEAKQEQVRELREKLKKPEDPSEKQEIEQKIARTKLDITSLQVSFEHLALGGINRSILNEQPDQQINWQEELEQISRPLLSTLKELTAKPRQVDSLNRDIERLQDQIRVIDKALESINSLNNQALPPIAANPVKQLLIDWQQRKEDTQRKLEISQLKLDSLLTESETWQTSTGELITTFFQGRGLTLFLAIAVSLIIWLISKG
jgi:chromosome segregation ATPase